MKFNDIVLLIIGIGGVGKEHLRAASILGIKNVYLMYHSQRTKKEFQNGLRLGYVWNRWDVYKEKIPIPKNTVLVKDFAEIQSVVTHTIIATPTSSHSEVVRVVRRHCRGSRVMLEKPISEDKHKIKVDYVGYNYHFIFKGENNVLMLVNSKKHPGQGKIEYDLLSHLIYSALENKREIVKVSKVNKDYCYAVTNKGDYLFADRNQKKHFVYYNGVVYPDYASLFTEQLRKFAKGQSNYPLAVQAESYLL